MRLQKPFMNLVTRACILALSLLSFFSWSVEKQEPLVAAVIDLPPFGCPRDYTVCYHNWFFAGLGRELKQPVIQVILPYARAVSAAKSGQVDLILIGKNEELDEASVALGTLYTLEFSLFSKVDIRSVAELAQLRIGIIRSRKQTMAKLTGFDLSKAYEVDNYTSANGMLKKDRLDAYFAPTSIAHSLPANVKSYLGTDFGQKSWRLEVVLYCRAQACSMAERSKIQHEMNESSRSLLNQVSQHSNLAHTLDV